MYSISKFSNMRNLFTVAVIPLLISCSAVNKSLNPKDYLSWYQSSGFSWKGTDTIQSLTCAIRFFPQEVSIAKCALENCEEKNILDERLASKEKSMDFLVELTSLKPNVSIFELPGSIASSGSDRVTYFSNTIKRDIKALTASGDTIECKSVVYEPLIPQKVRMLINIDPVERGIVEIILSDRIIYGQTFHFRFPELTNKSIPSLKL